MKPSTFENELNRLTGNVWLISESEHSFTYQHLGKLLPPALPATLAGRHQAADAQVRTLTPEAFISKIEKAAAHADSVIVANTQKIKNLVQQDASQRQPPFMRPEIYNVGSFLAFFPQQ